MLGGESLYTTERDELAIHTMSHVAHILPPVVPINSQTYPQV